MGKIQKTKEKIKKIKNKVKNGVKDEFRLNLPTMLNLSRILLAFVVVCMLFLGADKFYAGIVFVIAALTDWFDGFFARKFKLVSDLGARLDQISDRVFTGIIVIALVVYFSLHQVNNILLLLLVCSREIIGLPAFLIRLVRNKETYAVRYIGKLTTFIQSVAIASIIFGFSFSNYMAFATCIVGIVAGFDYLRDSFS